MNLIICPQIGVAISNLTVAGVGWQERMRHACLKNLVPVRALIAYHGASTDTIGPSAAASKAPPHAVRLAVPIGTTRHETWSIARSMATIATSAKMRSLLGQSLSYSS